MLPNGAASSRQVAGARGSGDVISTLVTDNYGFQVGSDVQSVTAGESLSGRHFWGFNTNNGASSSLVGVQLQFAADASGSNYTNSSVFDFNYKFFPADPNAFVPNNACPAPTASAEACPSPAVTLPPGSGEITVFAGNGKPITGTAGFDVTRSIAPIPSSSDSAVAVTVALQDARYGSAAEVAVRGVQDNADPGSTPTITQNGQPLPNCQQAAAGAACFVPADFAAYQYTTSSGSSATCESVSTNLQNAQVGTQYLFAWQENESTSSGCPVGEPGITALAWTAVRSTGTQSCDAGSDCSATESITDLGDVTTTVGPGQGVTGFDRNRNAIYTVNFAGETAPPPPAGTTSSAFGSSTTPTGTASATNAGTTAAGSGVGGLVVAQWGSDPVSTLPFAASGQYFDVQVLSGSTFSAVTIQNCNIASGDSLDWWNGTTWLAVTPQSYNPGPPACVTAHLSDTSSPAISQLGGTIFAVASVPVLSLASRTLRLSGKHLGVRLGCAHAACRGTASLTTNGRKPVLLGRATYSLAAGSQTTVTVGLRPAARTALARSGVRAVAARLVVSLAHGSPLVARVRITR